MKTNLTSGHVITLSGNLQQRGWQKSSHVIVPLDKGYGLYHYFWKRKIKISLDDILVQFLWRKYAIDASLTVTDRDIL